MLPSGIPVEVRLQGPPGTHFKIKSGEKSISGEINTEGDMTLRIPVSSQGLFLYTGDNPTPVAEDHPKVLSPVWALFPPLLAIALALWRRQVLLALFAGVAAGAWLVAGWSHPLAAIHHAVDGYLLNSFADPDHMSILMFTLMLGGMVGLVTRNGGIHGIVAAIGRKSVGPTGVQTSASLMGITIFFDDYANTLLVGSTFRPLTDRFGVSRERLAFIVDATAAPVASLAIISTWIGFEVGLIADNLPPGSGLDAYLVFIQSIPFRFYPLFALALVFMSALMKREIGPMYKAEMRARAGHPLRPGSSPLADTASAPLQPPKDKPKNWWNAAIPIFIVVLVTGWGLYFTGRSAILAEGGPLPDLGTLKGWGFLLSSASSLKVLLWASMWGGVSAALLALSQRLLTFSQTVEAWVEGVRGMTMAVLILGLAWAIGGVCADIHTADVVRAAVGGWLPAFLIPSLVFLAAAAMSFATGTSWGTMSLLFPLAVPLGVDHGLLVETVSSVLAGAVFGDHCSPISDTTILSSMATGCDHTDHVRTQLPYALLAAGVGILAGDIPTALGLPWWVAIPIGLAILWLILRIWGRKVPDQLQGEFTHENE